MDGKVQEEDDGEAMMRQKVDGGRKEDGQRKYDTIREVGVKNQASE